MPDAWSVVSSEPADAAAAPAADGWAVVSAKAPKGVPSVSAHQRTLSERYHDNFDEGFRSSLFGAGAGAMAAAQPGPEGTYNRERNAEDEDLYQLRSATDPWYKAPGGPLGKIAAGASTLAGTIAGGLPSPEGWVGFEALPEELGLKAFLKGGAKAAAKNFVAGAASDPAVQALQDAAGTHEGFDPWRVVTAGAANAVIPIGLHVAGVPLKAGARAMGRAAKAGADMGRDAAGKVGQVVGDLMDRVDGEHPIPTREADQAGWTVASQEPVTTAAVTPGPDADGWRVAGQEPAPAPDEPSTWTPEREAAFRADMAQRGHELPPETAHPLLSEQDAHSLIGEIAPGATITSGYRTPEHNAEVHGVPNSLHTRGGGQAADFVPPKGLTLEAFRTELQRRGLPVTELLNEGDHFHWGWGPKGGHAPPAEAGALSPAMTPDRVAPDDIHAQPEEPPGPAAGQAPDAGEPPAPGGGDQPRVDAARGSEDLAAYAHLDPNHARLYELGKQAEAGAADMDLASDLARKMSPFMDWSDEEGLSKRERQAIADGQGVSGRRMIETAREYAQQFDAPENAGHPPSFYDPDKYEAAMRANRAAQASGAAPEAVEPAAAAQPPPEPIPPVPAPRRAERARGEREDREIDYHQRLSTERARKLMGWPPLDEVGSEAGAEAATPATGRLAMFAGRDAKTADAAALARARAMEREAVPSEAIRQETGWSRGDDGEWRFEISDHDALFREGSQPGLFGPRAVGLDRLHELSQTDVGLARLDSVIHHPKLFEAYPALRRVSVAVGDMRALGAMSGDTLELSRRLVDDEPEKVRGVILHEIQHAVQNREGFAMGAPANADGLRAQGYGRALDEAPERLKARGREFQGPVSDVYRRSAGEVEARNTEHRRAMTDAERVARGPDKTRDIAPEDTIVVRNTREGPAEFPNRAARQEAADVGDRPATIDREGKDSPADLNGHREGPDGGDAGDVTDRPAGAKLEAREGEEGGPPSIADARKPGAVAKAGAEPFKGRPISELAADLRVALGITHRQGRLSAKKALGEYDMASGVVRTRQMHELDALSHEIAHAIEFMRKPPELLKALQDHAETLKAFDYEPDKGRRHEGFAEWFRWYVTDPETARKLAPAFYGEFERAMRADMPDAFAKIGEVQKAYSHLITSASLDVAAASVAHTGTPGLPERIKKTLDANGLGGAASDMLHKAYGWFLDDLHPLKRAEARLLDMEAARTGGRRDLKAAESPYVLSRLSREAYAAGRLAILEGVTPLHGADAIGPSLADALEKALGAKFLGKWSEKDLRAFDAYLISRRMVHEWDRFDRGELDRPPDKMPKAWHEQVIADAGGDHPEWGGAAQLLYEYQANLWDLEHAAGFISDETHQAGQAMEDYVPLMRDMSDKKGVGGPKGAKGSGQFAGGAKKFRGSSRDVISPVTSIMRRTYELHALVKQNEIIGKLDALAQGAGPGGGEIAERLPKTETEVVKVDAIAALEAAAKAQGVATRDVTTMVAAAQAMLGPEAGATLFHARRLQPKPGEAIVFHWQDGEPHPILIGDPDLYTALIGMNKEMSNGLVDLVSAGTQLLRHGVTLSPEFMARNIVRDQMATWINTDVGFTPGYDFVKGAIMALRGGETAQRYQHAGGLRGGLNTSQLKKPFPRDDAAALKQLRGLNHGVGRRARGLNPLSLHGLATLTDLSETGSRMGVFKRAFDKAKKTGLSDYEAMVEAAYHSRDYMDFGRRGSKMLTAVRIVTFLNAQLQGLDKIARVLSANGNLQKVLAPFGRNAPQTAGEKRALAHAYKAYTKLATLAVFGGVLRLLYKDDPEYEEFSEQTRATHWIFRAMGKWWRIPKPFELAEPSNLLERFIEWKMLKDPKAPENMLRDAAQTMAPPYEIPAVSVPFQIARNRDYQGRPIIPDHLVGTVDPELQFNAYTSRLGKKIGHELGVSPAVVDQVITGFGGSLGKYVLQGTNLAGEKLSGEPSTAAGPEDAFMVRAFATEPARGSVSQKEFWDQVSKTGGKLTEAEGSFRLYMRQGDDAKAAEYLNGLPANTRAYVLARVLSEKGASKIHPLVRGQATAAVISELRRDVRDGSLATMSGTPIQLSDSQRHDVDQALGDLGMVEMRNALITAGEEGWRQKALIPRAEAMGELRAVDPRLPGLVRALETEQGILPAGAAAKLWRAEQPLLEREVDPKRLAAILATKRLKSTNKTEKREEAVRIVRGRQEGVGL